jgi:hypothetical protein
MRKYVNLDSREADLRAIHRRTVQIRRHPFGALE